MKPGNHIGWLYETEEDHRAVLTPFLREGLERGEKVSYIMDAHTAETIVGYLWDPSTLRQAQGAAGSGQG